MNDATIKPDRPPVPAATPVSSFGPVILQVPGRQVDLQLRVSVPATGRDLPVILFSHGFGRSNFIASMRGYGPLVDFYAAHGFVVIQPTHQSSKTLGLDPNGPEGPLFWRSRAGDMRAIIDRLDEVENQVPDLAGRLDRTRIAAVGHSMGGHTVAMLAGMRVTDPVTGEVVDLRIVDAETIARVRAEMKARERPGATPTNRAKHLLSGLLRCGSCGANHVLAGKGYYRCVRNKDRGTCDDRTSVRVARAEEAVLAALQSHLLLPDLVKLFADEFAIRSALRNRAVRERSRSVSSGGTSATALPTSSRNASSRAR